MADRFAGWFLLVSLTVAGAAWAITGDAVRDGALTMFVALDGRAAGAIVLDDPLRADAPRTIRVLRRSGIRRVELVTGDRADVAESVGAIIGVDEVRAPARPDVRLGPMTSPIPAPDRPRWRRLRRGPCPEVERRTGRQGGWFRRRRCEAVDVSMAIIDELHARPGR
jgi:hypothetical protein